MATSDLSRNVKTALGIASEYLALDRIQLKGRPGMVILQERGKPVGMLSYVFVSRKYAGFGAAFGMYVKFCMTGGKVIDALKQLKLPFISDDEEVGRQFFSFSTLRHKKERFLQKDGHVSYYREDNVVEKSREVINKINSLYSKEIQQFIDASMDTVTDIFNHPVNYGYPLIYVMIICHLNGETARLPELLADARKKKVPLVSPVNMKKLTPIQQEQISADNVLQHLNLFFRKA